MKEKADNTPKKIRFVVIGLGHIGRRHVAMIRGNANCELVGCCDEAVDTVLATDAGLAPCFPSIEALINSETVEFDVAVIATPNGLHEAHAIQILRSGHHVVIEKPMALSTAGCERIIAAANHAGKQVFCVMQNRYSAPAAWLKQICEQGLLGQIFIVETNCYWNRDERYYTRKNWHGSKALDGGTLFTQFSHFVDTIFWLFGDVRNIRASFRNFNHKQLTEFEDTGFVQFDFEKGGTGLLNYSTAVWNKNLESSITIIAEKGTIKLGGQYLEKVEYCNISGYHFEPLHTVEPIIPSFENYTGAAANHYFVIDHVAKTLQQGLVDESGAKDGSKVVEIIERIYQSGND